jgi:hypothetical protein
VLPPENVTFSKLNAGIDWAPLPLKSNEVPEVILPPLVKVALGLNVPAMPIVPEVEYVILFVVLADDVVKL